MENLLYKNNPQQLTCMRSCNKISNFTNTIVSRKSVAPSPTTNSVKKQEAKKDYGSWGPVFKDKKNFTDMHLC